MSASSFNPAARTTIFNRLDIRAKLSLVIVVIFLCFLWESPVAQLALFSLVVIASLAGGVTPRYLGRIFLLMLPFVVILLMTHGFFNVAQVKHLTGKSALTPILTLPASWWLVGGGVMTREGLFYGLNVALKSLTIVLVAPLVVFTSDVDEMMIGLVRARIPYRIVFIFAATLRFFPLLFQEARNIIEAQRLRGLVVERMNLIKRARVYARIAVPLILNAMVRSQQFEVVLQSKGFSGDGERTYLFEAVLKSIDYAVMGTAVLFLLLAIGAYVGFGFGKFV
jgi:energy-coupling factor transport system permease protein